MSDTRFSDIQQLNSVMEKVDKEWAEDCLSDDEIELPNDQQLADDEDEIPGEEGTSTEQSHETWNDLGLDRFLTESK